MEKETCVLFFEKLKKVNPYPQIELSYNNAYQLLVAVVLSAQATDKGVNLATKVLFEKVKTPTAMLQLGEESLMTEINRIGLFRTKARNVIKMSQQLLEKHEGRVPNNREALEALPGVGRKTANVVLNAVFNEPTIAVDTHIFRVSNRTGMSLGKTVNEVEAGLNKIVPKQFKKNAHLWLILLGRYTCKARKPICGNCPVQQYCGFDDKINQ